MHQNLLLHQKQRRHHGLVLVLVLVLVLLALLVLVVPVVWAQHLLLVRLEQHLLLDHSVRWLLLRRMGLEHRLPSLLLRWVGLEHHLVPLMLVRLEQQSVGSGNLQLVGLEHLLQRMVGLVRVQLRVGL
jgi:hypothetical protein